jgi:predicted Zn-dependent protease
MNANSGGGFILKFLSRLMPLVALATVLSGSRSRADIIPPPASAAANQQVMGIPESMRIELDSEIADKLQPWVVEYLSSRNLASFQEAYSKIFAQTDTLPAVDVFLGKLYAAYNQVGEAISILERYTNQNAEDPEAFVTLGSIAVRSGRVVDAWLQLLYAQRLIDRDKLPAGRMPYVHPVLTELRASVAERRRQWSEAEQLFRKLQELKPETALPLWRAGRIKVLAGEVQAGYEVLRQAHEKDGSLPHPALVVAQTLNDSSDWLTDPKSAARVENWFQKAVSESENNKAAWASYFKWLILADRPAEVAQRYDQLPESLRAEREIGLVRSLAARYLNDLQLAESILSSLHQFNTDDLDVADQLALVLVESTDEAKRARALQLAERNARQAPQVEQLMATAAWVQFRLGSIDVAEQVLSQLVARGNLSPQTAYYVAEVMEKSGRIEESQRLLRLAVDAPGVFPQRSIVKQRLTAK